MSALISTVVSLRLLSRECVSIVIFASSMRCTFALCCSNVLSSFLSTLRSLRGWRNLSELGGRHIRQGSPVRRDLQNSPRS